MNMLWAQILYSVLNCIMVRVKSFGKCALHYRLSFVRELKTGLMYGCSINLTYTRFALNATH